MIPHAYPVAAIAVLLGLAGAYIKGRSDGGELVRSEYAQRDLQAANETAAQISGINQRIRAKERQWAEKFAGASQTYQGRLKANEKALDIALAGRLFDRAANQACGGSPGSPAPGASGRNGEAGAYLPESTSRFLLGLASEADAVVLQLQACQAILESERQ